MKKEAAKRHHDIETSDHINENEWKKERELYIGALKMINKELEEQKRVSLDLRKRLLALETKNTEGVKKAADSARGTHRKTNSELVKNPVDLPQKPDENKRKQPVTHKTKGSLEDYAAKKAQYKMRRSKKEPSSASYGGYGKLFCSGEGGNAGSFGRGGVDITRKLSSKNTVTPGQSGVLTARVGPEFRTSIKPIVQEELYSIHEDNTHISVLSDCTDGSNVTTVHVAKKDWAGGSPRNSEPEELNITTRKEDIKDGDIISLKGWTIGGTYNQSVEGLFGGDVTRHSMTSARGPSTSLLSEKCVLRAHMDGVRDLQFSSVLNYLMTVSEDCLVKLWDIKGLKKNSVSHPSKIEPYFTYRGHTGPLFSACVGAGLQQEDHFLYSAGSEGIIRIWSIPTLETTKYPSTNGKNYCVGLWTSHRDVIWQLVHHPTDRLLLSVSSDGTVKMWKEFDFNEYSDNVDKNSNDCLLGAFVYKSSTKHCFEVPTSAAWTASHNSLLISYVSPMLGIFDRITGKLRGTARFDPVAHLKPGDQQINRVIAHPTHPLAVTAHENGMLRFFDLGNLKQTRVVPGHAEGISTVTGLKDGHYIMTGGYDGVVKCWDLRKYQTVFETKCHNKKYDEGVHAIAVHTQMPFVATGGIDGTAKIFLHPF